MKSLKTGEFAELAYAEKPKPWRVAVPVDEYIEAPNPEPVADIEKACIEKLDNPLQRPPLSDWVRGAGRVALVIPDATRRFQFDKIVPLILSHIYSGGIKPEQITVVVAHGLHSKSGPAPAGGWGTDDSVNLIRHDARDSKQLAYAGKLRGRRLEYLSSYLPGELSSLGLHPWDSAVRIGTSWFAGTRRKIRINKAVMEADRVILAGNIYPHNFAGYSGGAKLLLPGVADERSILINHALQHHPLAKPGILRNNPARAEIDEVIDMVPESFLLGILNSAYGTYDVVAGRPLEAFYEGAEKAREKLAVKIKKAGLVVLSVSPPASNTLYQLARSSAAACRIIKPDGVLILAGSCCEGYGDLKGVRRMVRHSMATLLPDGVRVFALTDLGRSARKKIRSVGIEPLADMEEGVRFWRNRLKDLTLQGVAVIPDATAIIPYDFREENPKDWI